MQKSKPQALKSDEPPAQRSNHRQDDDCPECGAVPIRFGTYENNNASIKRYCPGCEAYHWELVAEQKGHDTVRERGGVA